MSPTRLAADALEARVATRLAAALSAAQPPLPADTAERLRFARSAALQRARASQASAQRAAARPLATALALRTAGPALPGGPFGAPVPWWQRAMALLPLVVLVAGLVGIDHWATQEQIATTADIDAELLADDLPPEAYADPGFAEFLRDEPPVLTP